MFYFEKSCCLGQTFQNKCFNNWNIVISDLNIARIRLQLMLWPKSTVAMVTGKCRSIMHQIAVQSGCIQTTQLMNAIRMNTKEEFGAKIHNGSQSLTENDSNSRSLRFPLHHVRSLHMKIISYSEQSSQTASAIIGVSLQSSLSVLRLTETSEKRSG